ncbi:FAD-binding oxidoreductase [Microbacterium atlanticum]|uniref:FAD-binding oxidoreductase n=1 Tax=Microbacterium atlanticum TaxID=2782168 RepID=UPI001888DB9A|nr:FAD-binding oxidoreductase [Microbacterium atlanticum]
MTYADTFEITFTGEILRPGDPSYEERRFGYNRRFPSAPAVIARPRTTADISAAVIYAREMGWEFAVRGGGHHTGGISATDGLLLDMGLMNEVKADPETATLRLQGGALMGAVQAEATRIGMGAALGVNSTPGIGVIIGGGLGYLSPKHGWGCDNIVSAELVTANGDVVHVSAESHPELLRGVRGAAANFGVVSSLEIALHTVPATVLAGGMLWVGRERARAAIEWLRSFRETASEDLAFYATLEWVGGSRGVPADLVGQPGLSIIVCHVGEAAAAASEIGEIRRTIPADLDDVRQMTFLAVHGSMEDMITERGEYKAEDDEVLTSLSDEALDALFAGLDLLSSAPDATTERAIQLYPEACAIARGDVATSALGVRGATQWAVHSGSYFSDLAHTDDEQGWASGVVASVRATPAGTGSPGTVNWIGVMTPERARAAYANTYDDLAALKAVWDPTNFFRRNANIVPAGGSER